MKIVSTDFKNLLIYQKKYFNDKRGYLSEVYKHNLVGLKNSLDIVSKSKKNVIRGFHFQKKFQQKKFVSVLKGEIIDICIDLRSNSKKFGKFFMIKLSEKNGLSLLVPKGFAHGFLSLSDSTIVHYRCSNIRKPQHECVLAWNDKDLRIPWPKKKKFILSRKDKLYGMSFSHFKKKIKSL